MEPGVVDILETRKIGEFYVVEPLTPALRQRLIELADFYTAERLEEIIIPRIADAGMKEPSLRLLNWVVMNYAQAKGLIILDNNNHPHEIYREYRKLLAAYGRQLFDPFKRGPKLVFIIRDTRYETTVGQLNFMYWLHSLALIDYTRRHLQELSAHMSQRTMLCKQLKREHFAQYGKKKRAELAQPATSTCSIIASPFGLSLHGISEQGLHS